MRGRIKVEDYPELHKKEVSLINAIRIKYRNADIVVVTQDGIPMRIKSAILKDNLLE